MSDSAGTRRGPSFTGLFLAAAWLALALVGAVIVAGRIWPVGLMTNFVPQLAASVLAGVVVSVMTRQWISSGVLGIGLLALGLVTAQGLPSLGGAESADDDLMMLFANVNRANEDRTSLADLVREHSPDMIGLSEIDSGWVAALSGLEEAYPHSVFEARDDNFGIALLSRIPLLDSEVVFLGTGGLPSIRASVEHLEQRITVVITHPIPPINEYAAGVRDDQMTAIAEMIRALDHSAVLLGDLNDSPWSPTFRDFTRASGMKSAARGVRSLYTWPVGLAPLFVQLDHCLHTPDLEARGFEVLSNVGSDHYPISCRVSGGRG